MTKNPKLWIVVGIYEDPEGIMSERMITSVEIEADSKEEAIEKEIEFRTRRRPWSKTWKWFYAYTHGPYQIAG